MFQTPSTESNWENIAKEFERQWNFPRCIGPIDGRHIQIKQPRNSGLYYFSYKGVFSIALLALADTNYNFIYIDVNWKG